jgi:NADH dehydrogenase
MFLVGFRNRVSVLTQWAYNYLFFERGVRLITETEDASMSRHPAKTGKTGEYEAPSAG